MTSPGPPSADPGRARLSTERIVGATLELIDSQGIAMASMRSVGERLGVRAMSLYRYVSSREVLFDLVVEHIVDELSTDADVLSRPEQGWQDYLTRLAHGVRRYAVAHPHAFPLVATRPARAPWINPPLRSLRWIEAMLDALREAGFDDEQVLFTYRAFNSFLLGSLLLETSALTMRDPLPGDGSFQRGTDRDGTDPVDPGDPVPGALSPARSSTERDDVGDAGPAQAIDPADNLDLADFPSIERLHVGLVQDHYAEEFDAGLRTMLARVADLLRPASGTTS